MRETSVQDALVQVPTLTGGVSRQPAHLRYPNQLEDATNVLGRIGDGLSPRAGARILAAVSGFAALDNIRFHTITRDSSEKYLAAYRGYGTDSSDPKVRVFDTAGTEYTVFTSDAALTYLKNGSPTADDMRLVTIADFTFILNTLVSVAASTSAAYTISGSVRDYDALLATLPGAGEYYGTEDDTEVQPKGYWQYQIASSGDNGFAYWTGPANTGSHWAQHDNTNSYLDIGKNPMGFKVTFRDRASVDHVYNVVDNFWEKPPTSMFDIARRFTARLNDLGATDALVSWVPSGARSGKFKIVAPYRGTGAAVQSVAAPDNAFDLTQTGSTPIRPFQATGATATAGTGDPSSPTFPVLDRWERVPAPAQATAEIDETTMPIQMRRLKAPYYEGVILADAPLHYYRLGETSGTTITDEMAATGGTYVSATSAASTLIAGDTDGAQQFGSSLNYGNLGTLGTLGSTLNSGATFEFWINTSTSVSGATILGEAVSTTNHFYIAVNYSAINGDICVFLQQTTGTQLIGRTSAVNLRDGTTHHVVCYVKASTNTVRIWIDNVERTVTYDAQNTPVMVNFTQNVYLAARNTGAASNRPGSMNLDELAIYSGLLTTQQINKHYKYGIASTVFDIDLVEWGFRKTGDEDTNPVPSIWEDGDKLADIGFHRNRLVLVGDENVVTSQAGSFFDFYIENANNIAESDPIDLALSAAEVTLADFVVPFNKAMVIFTKAGRQFELNAPEALTPTTAAITPSTRYESQAVRPKPLGTFIYFAAKKKNATIIYEYFYDDSRVSNTAAEVTAHVHDYLPINIRTIEASANNNTVLVLPKQDTDGINLLYHYQFFYSASRKEQSAWHKFTFKVGSTNQRICDIGVIDNDCYMLMEYPSGTFTLQAMSLSREQADSGWPWPVHLDGRSLVTGVFAAGVTTFTLPAKDPAVDTIVLGPAFGASAGTVLTVTPVGPAYLTATIAGDYSAGQVAIGRLFTISAELTRPFLRNSATQQEGPEVVSGRMTVHHLTTYHKNTGEYKVRVSQPGRTDRTRTFTAPSGSTNGLATGTMRQWVKGKADDARVFIESTSPKPFIISAAEWMTEFAPANR